MTDDNQRKLQQAYDLIRQERFEEAQLLLQPIIFNAPSADAWWLWANAVTEPEDARHALSRVLEFDPDHPQARQLLTRLEHIYPAEPDAEPLSSGMRDSADFSGFSEQPPIEADIPEILPPGLPVSEADIPADDEDFEPAIRQLEYSPDDTESDAALDFSDWLEDLAETEQAGSSEVAVAADAGLESPSVVAQKGRSAWRGLLLILLVLVIGLGLAVVLLQLNDSQRPAVTERHEWTPVNEPGEQLQAVVQAAQQGLNADEMGGAVEARLVQYEDGAALLIEVCRGASADLPAVMQAGMAQAARYGISAQDELSHVGISLVNCERQDILVEALTTIDAAASFASGAIDETGYKATWQFIP